MILTRLKPRLHVMRLAHIAIKQVVTGIANLIVWPPDKVLRVIEEFFREPVNGRMVLAHILPPLSPFFSRSAVELWTRSKHVGNPLGKFAARPVMNSLHHYFRRLPGRCPAACPAVGWLGRCAAILMHSEGQAGGALPFHRYQMPGKLALCGSFFPYLPFTCSF